MEHIQDLLSIGQNIIGTVEKNPAMLAFFALWLAKVLARKLA